MTHTQFEARKERSANGALIASKTEDGFRVYSLHNPSKIYLVTNDGQRWTCTCPDFEFHQADSTWRCKHILAVAPWPNGEEAQALPSADAESAAPPATDDSGNGSSPRKRRIHRDSPPVQMLIKRSVSPDGRIDSVSVEFSMPVSDITESEIKAKALTTLQLQREIVTLFLKLNGRPAPDAPAHTESAPQALPENGNGKPVFARMIDIGKVNGKWGARFCINFQVDGRKCRLFGSAEQLATHMAAAGYDIDPENITEGLRLNLACRAITKPSDDGRYLNVERVLPAAKNLPAGGNHGAAFN
jgi:hypothetical protein